MAVQRQLRVLATEVEPGRSIRVAFSSSDLKRVDQHFGSAERFAIYRIGSDSQELEQVAEFGELAEDGNENKLLEKFSLLEGCVAVYSQAVGPSAVRQLLALGIQPMKVSPGTPLSGLLEQLQLELREAEAGLGSGWLARALAADEKKSPERFDAMEDEGWDE